MKILTEYNELVGKKIAFSHMAEFAEQITLATEDGCILMAKMEDCIDDTRIKVLYPHQVIRVLEKNEWLRKELGNLGIFDIDKYNEEQRVKREKEKEEFRKRQEEKEREEYERLKAKFERIKLTYTEEMKEQDRLWQNEEENLETMKKLYLEIIAEAKEKGFEGVVDIYDVSGEMLCEIFKNEEELRLARLGEYEDFDSVGYCKPLIEHLEEIINEKQL